MPRPGIIRAVLMALAVPHTRLRPPVPTRARDSGKWQAGEACRAEQSLGQT
jgi:hypothetical protein